MKAIKRALDYLFDDSLLLVLGALAGLAWANLDIRSFAGLLHLKLLANNVIGTAVQGGSRVIDLQYLVNDVLMAFFFALAGREVWDALLPGGPLHDRRQAAMPMVSAVGGMIGPAVIYVGGAAVMGRFPELHHGWAIPCATDIAFSYMVAKLVFGKFHPAIPFLLILAIVDDALGLVVLAVFYPQEAVQPVWLGLPLAAIGLALVMRQRRVHGFWWYLIGPGAISWLGFALSGLHPRFGLLPIVPLIPHERALKSHVGWDVLVLREKWDRFGTSLKKPVEVILAVFGMLNAGVPLGMTGPATLLVLGGLLIGKPVGIFVSAMLAAKFLKARLPKGASLRDLWVTGCAAGVGFTVALFVTTVAFRPGPLQDAAKIGALASVSAAAVAWAAAKILGVGRVGAKKSH